MAVLPRELPCLQKKGELQATVGTYVIRRFLQMIPILILISLLTFLLMRLAGPDPAEYMITLNPRIKPADIQAEKFRLGLVDANGKPLPLISQYFTWVRNILRGDWGWSRIWPNQTAFGAIMLFLPNSLILMGLSLILSLIIAIPIGIYSALKQYSSFDYVFTTFSFMGMSLPTFWLALMSIIIFHLLPSRLFGFPLFPAGDIASFGKPFAGLWYDRIWHLFLPVVVLGIYNMAGWTRYMRSSLLEVIRSDYVRTARAKGLPESKVINKHALRNALIPMVTILTLSIPSLFGGALITETVFAYPGVGRMLYQAVIGKDYAVAMADILLLAVITIFFNLVADILYAVVDPRIRYS
ncbi:MAG: ABC transporter permease [Deltaproteobacteria bacterium]|nr:ABC transporter permease [Deltaproteobacteria bacterium]